MPSNEKVLSLANMPRIVAGLAGQCKGPRQTKMGCSGSGCKTRERASFSLAQAFYAWDEGTTIALFFVAAFRRRDFGIHGDLRQQSAVAP